MRSVSATTTKTTTSPKQSGRLAGAAQSECGLGRPSTITPSSSPSTPSSSAAPLASRSGNRGALDARLAMPCRQPRESVWLAFQVHGIWQWAFGIHLVGFGPTRGAESVSSSDFLSGPKHRTPHPRPSNGAYGSAGALLEWDGTTMEATRVAFCQHTLKHAHHERVLPACQYRSLPLPWAPPLSRELASPALLSAGPNTPMAQHG